jgi:hypothetical protein
MATYVSPTVVELGDSDLSGLTNKAFKITAATTGDSDTFMELDLDVEATTIDKGNWNQTTGLYSTLDGGTLPNSVYLTGKPTWFGNLTWPPVDSTNVTQRAYDFEENLMMMAAGGLTCSGTTATAVTDGAHGFSTGDYIQIWGSSQWQYNGNFQITVTGANSFTYTMRYTSGTSPATTVSGIAADKISLDTFVIPAMHRFALNNETFLVSATQLESTNASATTITVP